MLNLRVKNCIMAIIFVYSSLQNKNKHSLHVLNLRVKRLYYGHNTFIFIVAKEESAQFAHCLC